MKVSAGKLRSQQIHETILKQALALVLKNGFRAVSIEAISLQTGVAKTTIYRRWPNKAAVIMEAFIVKLGAASQFPEADNPLESVRLQMHAMARSFRTKDGMLVKALLAESQFDASLARAFRDQWTLPRRLLATLVLQRAVKLRKLRADVDLEVAIDALYGPIYYRLQMATGALSEEFVESIYHHVVEGLVRR